MALSFCPDHPLECFSHKCPKTHPNVPAFSETSGLSSLEEASLGTTLTSFCHHSTPIFHSHSLPQLPRLKKLAFTDMDVDLEVHSFVRALDCLLSKAPKLRTLRLALSRQSCPKLVADVLFQMHQLRMLRSRTSLMVKCSPSCVNRRLLFLTYIILKFL